MEFDSPQDASAPSHALTVARAARQELYRLADWRGPVFLSELDNSGENAAVGHLTEDYWPESSAAPPRGSRVEVRSHARPAADAVEEVTHFSFEPSFEGTNGPTAIIPVQLDGRYVQGILQIWEASWAVRLVADRSDIEISGTETPPRSLRLVRVANVEDLVSARGAVLKKWRELFS